MQERKASNRAGAPLLGRHLAVQPHPSARGALSRSATKVLPQDPAQPSPGPLRPERIPPSPGYGLSSLVNKITCSEANLLPARTATDSCQQDDSAPECKLSELE